MKIALLTEKYTPDVGGLAISSARLARLLTTAGHAVHVFAPTAGLLSSEERTTLHDGVAVRRFGAHKRVEDSLQYWFELLVREHRREGFDLVHAYFLPQAGFVAAYAATYLGLPSVVSARGNDLDRAIFDPERAAHILFALRSAGAVTTNASELARKARSLVPGLEVAIIPNGIDAQHFRPMSASEDLGLRLGLEAPTNGGRKAAVIGFVGELRKKKGLQALLDGYAHVADSLPATLLIVGDVRPGEDRRAFDDFKTSNAQRKIVLTGYLPPSDLPAYFGLMDVFAHPSLRDGLPNAVLEAMACARPVVATPVGGVPDAIQDGENGILVSQEDPMALASSIERLLGDSRLSDRYGRAARETVLRQFTPQAELDGNLAVYRRLGMRV